MQFLDIREKDTVSRFDQGMGFEILRHRRTDFGQHRLLVDLRQTAVFEDSDAINDHPVDRASIFAVDQMLAEVIQRR